MAGGNKQQSQQSFDPEIKQRLLQVYDTGADLAQQPFQPYLNATVAPASPAQLQGMQAAANLARAGVGQQGVQSAINAAQNVAGFAPTTFDVNTGANVADIGTDFGVAPTSISALPQVSAMRLGAVDAVQTPTIGSSAVQARDISALPTVQAQQIGPLAALSPERLAQTSAIQTGQISASPVTAQQVTGQVVGAQSLADVDLTPYQNQFQTGVIDAALGDIERARQMAQGRNRAAAVSANAYGGDRQALLESETNRGFAEQAAETAALLRAQGFESAARRAEADVGRSQAAGLQTAQMAQQANLANQQAGLQAGTTSAELGLQGQIESGRQALQSGLAAQSQNTQRSLANQQAGLSAGQQNLQAELARQQANQQAGLTAGQQNLQAELARQQANQRASLEAQTGSAERAQQAATESARLGQQGQLSAQDLTARNLLANQAQDLAAQQLGLTSELDRQRLNAANQLAAQQSTAQLGLEAARANQAANLEAALAQAQLESNLALARQQAELDAAGLNLRGAQSLAGLSEAQRGLAFQDAAALEAVGERQRGLAQETLEDRYRRFIEQRDFPLSRFDILRAGAGILPSPITQRTKGSGFSVLGG